MSQLRIQRGPPLPESIHVGIVFAYWYHSSLTLKVFGTVVHSAGGISAVSFYFLCPGAAELRAAVTAGKIANIVEIYFYVTGNDIVLKSSAGSNTIKVNSSPVFA
jgi:hypothetical protein